MDIVLVAGAIIAFVILVRLAAGKFDRSRIRDYVRRGGGELLSCQWAPFGPGWWGDKTDRIYRITYRDRGGDRHSAYCKTSMMSGVYLTEDKVFRGSRSSQGRSKSEKRSLAAENRRLRDEVKRLRREAKRRGRESAG